MGYLDPPAEAVIAAADSLAGSDGDRILRSSHLLDALSAEDGVAGRALRAVGVFPTLFPSVGNGAVAWSRSAREAIHSSLRVAVHRHTGRGCVSTTDLLLALLDEGDAEVTRRLEDAGTTAKLLMILVEAIDRGEVRPDPDSDQAAVAIIKAFEEEVVP